MDLFILSNISSSLHGDNLYWERVNSIENNSTFVPFCYKSTDQCFFSWVTLQHILTRFGFFCNMVFLNSNLFLIFKYQVIFSWYSCGAMRYNVLRSYYIFLLLFQVLQCSSHTPYSYLLILIRYINITV